MSLLLQAASAASRALALSSHRQALLGSNSILSGFNDVVSQESRLALWRGPVLLQTPLLDQLLPSKRCLLSHHEHGSWRLFISYYHGFTLGVIQHVVELLALAPFGAGLQLAGLSHDLALPGRHATLATGQDAMSDGGFPLGVVQDLTILVMLLGGLQ